MQREGGKKGRGLRRGYHLPWDWLQDLKDVEQERAARESKERASRERGSRCVVPARDSLVEQECDLGLSLDQSVI